MNRHFDPITYPPPSPARAGGAAIYDEGLRRHMLGVYRNLALGLGSPSLVALLIAGTPALYQPIFGTPLKWVAIFAPLAFVLFFSFRVERMTTAQARTAFYAFAAVMGVSMASIFLVFTGTSIALAFASAAAVFAAMSLWGYTTNRTEEHTSELQSLMRITYAGFCLKKNRHLRDTKHPLIHPHHDLRHHYR